MKKDFYTNIRQYGNDILYIGYDENSTRVQKRIKFRPTIYTQDNKGVNTGIRCYDGTPLIPHNFMSIREANDFVKTYESVSEVALYGMDRFQYQFIGESWKGIDVEYDITKIRRYDIDIETYSGDGFAPPSNPTSRITAISFYDTKTKKKYSWGESNSPGGKFIPNSPDIIYKEFSDEHELLHDFVAYWSLNYPDIVSGWNIDGYDIPYLINRITRVCGESTAKRLSPWGIIHEKTQKEKRFGKFEDVVFFDVWGINSIDYMTLYKKYTYTGREMYSLDFIVSEELGESKLEYEGTLHDLYVSDYQKYMEYNIHDVFLIQKLEDKLKFIELLLSVAYTGKVATYADAMGTVKYWEILIYNHLLSKNQQTKIKKFDSSDKDSQYEGAFVKDPIIGNHRWVVSYDLTSLYPSVIRTVNIGEDTLVNGHLNISMDDLVNKRFSTEKIVSKNLSLAANGKAYRKDHESFLSELMTLLFNRRKEYQRIAKTSDDENTRKVYDIKQLATKILLNSAYGACGNQHFQYFSIDNAEAVTVTGKLVILWTERKINEYLNKLLKTTDKEYVVYIDTDSVAGDSEIAVNGNKTTIAEFYDSIPETNFVYRDDEAIRYVKEIPNDSTTTTPSINVVTGKIECNKIKYVMKHRVKKRMYRICHDGDSVVVTGDHSIVVERNGKIKSIKPSKLRKGDKIIKI